MTVDTKQREQIADDVHASWTQLMEVLSAIDGDQFDVPGVVGIWSLKDLVGHIETWDRIAIRKLENAEENRTTAWWKIVGVQRKELDSFNEKEADDKRIRSLDDLWDEMLATHEEFVRRVETSPALSREIIREDTYGHYREHLADIRAWQSERT